MTSFCSKKGSILTVVHKPETGSSGEVKTYPLVCIPAISLTAIFNEVRVGVVLND